MKYAYPCRLQYQKVGNGAGRKMKSKRDYQSAQ